MPHINRVRLVNIKYNDAKSSYDNFMMNFEGKSATYDLQNGGGKSVMLLMLLQNVLPNTYLKADRPLKNIFKGGNPNRTSHCLIEWKLDDNADYKYLLTGFCARKKQEEGEEENDTLGVEYFNYAYLYNTQNENDIRQIPLIEETKESKTVMSYEKLKQHLSNMRKENLPVQTFTSKGEYLKYIEYFGLIRAEWKLINEINSGENNIETYFKVNKTSRKLIENFLIKIIDNINMQNSDEIAENEDLAEALINIKDNLMKFKQESDHKKEYEETKELFDKLKTYSKDIENNYIQKEKIHEKAYETYSFYEDKKEKLERQVKDENNQIEEYKKKYIELENQNSKLEIDKNYIEKEDVLNAKKENETKIENLTQRRDKLDNELKRARAQNEYLEYKEKKDSLEQKQIQIQKMSLNDSDIQREYNLYGANYLRLIKLNKKDIENKIEILNIKKTEENKKQEEQAKQVNIANATYISMQTRLEDLEEKIKEHKDDENNATKELTSRGYLEGLLNIASSIEELSESKQNLENERQENANKIEEAKNKISDNKSKEAEIKVESKYLDDKLEKASSDYENYGTQKRKMENLCKAFNVQTLEELQINKQIEKESIRKSKLEKEIQKQMKQTKLDLIQKYNIAVPNEDIFLLKDKLQRNSSYVTTGIEELTKMDDVQRKNILDKTPWFIYSVFIDNASFCKLKKQGMNYDIQNLVPIANAEFLRNQEESEQVELLYPISKEVYQNIDCTKLESYKKELGEKISQLDKKIKEDEKKENEIQDLMQECKRYVEVYSTEKVQEIEDELKKIRNKIEEKNNLRKQLIKDNEEQGEIIERLENKNKNIEKEIPRLEDDIKWFKDLKETKEIIKNKTLAKEELKKELDIAKEIFDNKNEELENINNLIKRYEQEGLQIQNNLENIKDTQKGLEQFEQLTNIEELNQEFDKIKNQYEALDKQMNSQNSQIKEIEDTCKILREQMEKCEKIIEENGFTISEFEESKEILTKTIDNVLSDLKEKCSKTEEEIRNYEKIENQYNQKISSIEGSIKILVEQLGQKGINYCEEEKEENIENINYKISENKQTMSVYENKRKDLYDKISAISKEIEKLRRETDRFRIFIEQYNIRRTDINLQNILESELYSYEKVNKNAKELEEQLRKLEKSWNDFIRHIKEQVKTFFIASDINDIIQNIIFPENQSEAERVKRGIEENILLIDEKIVHIEEALKSLAEYQEQFNSKCFEKAEVVVRDLNKLSGLSRIKIAGKETNIVKLDLYEYENDEKQARIKSYIESIVKEMESNPELMDKSKLNEKLSSKALVAQIVNMDKASVKLYKIEDIAEHSGYKKWEDDLGSDGQVNALYFMFAVCIISYISMLTRPDTLSNSKKVMIADNPFGATSAVYLWEGMFAMLKENNVQLIAPGHNISKELISKFEVNYVLKAEYKGDNSKCIVVDRELRTEHENQNMNFEVLKGTQESFL